MGALQLLAPLAVGLGLIRAALLAARRGKKKIEMIDVDDAREKVQFGRERRRLMDDEEKKLTAYHEAGHALIQALEKDADPVHKVSIIPRGPAGGATFSLPERDRKPACVLACPTSARLFGDIHDPESSVSIAIRDSAGYALMPEWGTHPANHYLPRRRTGRHIHADELERVKARFLGKSGSLTALLKTLGALAPDARREAGARINAAKGTLETALVRRREELADMKLASQLAAEALESAQTDLEFSSGLYKIKGTDRSIAISALARKFPGKLDLDYKDRPKVPGTFPNGCHIAEVEIDPETGECEIVSYLACDDVGNIVNHQVVEGQMQGGVTQGAGHIFGEQTVYDASGQLLTGSFMDYFMPRAGFIRDITIDENPVPSKANALGATPAATIWGAVPLPYQTNAMQVDYF